MPLISLAHAIALWPPAALVPVLAIALVGDLWEVEDGRRVRAEARGAILPNGELLMFDKPIQLTLHAAIVAAVQEMPHDKEPKQ